jgi:ketosteroid isomerase-like protein
MPEHASTDVARAETTTTLINAEVARRLFEAVDHRDSAGVAAAYDPQIVINEAPSLPYGGEYQGHAGARRHGQGFRAAWNRFQTGSTRRLDPLIIAQGEHVAVLWRHRVANPDTGASLDLPALSVFRLRDARIVESRMFHFDTTALLRFLADNSP